MKENKAYVYILKCSDDSLYTGYTVDLSKRLVKHNDGKASKYTRARLPVEYVYTKSFDSKNEAMSAENRIKRISRIKKLKLINGDISFEELTIEKRIKN